MANDFPSVVRQASQALTCRLTGHALPLNASRLEPRNPELWVAADFSWKNGLGGLHAALQSAIQLLQLVTGAGSVAAFITRRFTSHYQAVAQGLRQALAGASYP